VKIRSARARIHVDSWRAAYRGLVPDESLRAFTYEWREQCFRQSLVTEAEETHLAELGQKLVAFLTLGAARDPDLDPDRAGEIWGIYVLPNYWRQGIGTKLAQEAERLLISRGCEQAFLWVLEGNQRARQFYEAVGFRLDGESKTIDWGTQLSAVRYRKALLPIGEK
jgi:ribosomal protein S18 acetylase RimI-like enzyme